ncbi:spermidine/putrescine import ATP-binding protein PotA [Desulfosporosinus acididurans]|uniref:ABC-type quaternary amine transporter n=1 Tax=Desulfosporosinus acididurans TaxID=476652 RepID=A0A0J1INZ7_9FIRM|nr:ABC transporter ATP-binding protein [Desulfosporosinus acididurans]KLU66396.1 spermidine/putrescine import ATP-binding protein PotA [Desulfosporosinus acididurans]
MNLVLEDVTKHYGSKLVLDRLSLSISEGSCVALLGPSGCGKTTLLNALAGLTDIDGGKIRSEELTWSAKGYTMVPEERNIGMVFQDFALWPHMNVFENIAFSLRLKKYPAKKIKEQVTEVLEAVQMNGFEKRYPNQLSGGQRQRVAIARALVIHPSIMLMDEPLSSLDAQLREKMRWEIMRIVRGAGITTVYVTHDQAEALSLADHVVLLNQGRIEQADSPTRLYREPATVFAANFLGCPNILRGRVVERCGEHSLVNCQGLNIYTVGKLIPGQEAKVMIRSGDIFINSQSQGPGTLLEAKVLQRSFQGVTWQYKVALENAHDIQLEVWDTQEIEVTESIQLWLPAEGCRVLRDMSDNGEPAVNYRVS